MRAKRGAALGDDWAIDAEGEPTTDPQKALEGALLPFGGYKGSAISTMIELLAGPLIGDRLGHETAPASAHEPARRPQRGEMIIAMDPRVFLGDEFDNHIVRAEDLFGEIIAQGARLPSQRRHEAGQLSADMGVSVQREILAELRQLASSTG